MKICFDNRQNEIEITDEIIDIIEKSIKAVANEEKLNDDIIVSISFVNGEEIKDLNSKYRNVNQVTDVLSFPLDDEFHINGLELGDIVINTQRVLEQAKEFNHSNERELSYLTVHSALHLLGYDHIEENDKKTMRNKEKEIMNNLKIYKD